MEIFPCTLVFVEVDAAGSPNSTSKDPLSYARQAVCLNKTLLHAGMPRLNIFTNTPDLVLSCFNHVPVERQPIVHEIITTFDVPRNIEFYGAHYKLDLMEQVAEIIPPDTLLLLLDTDIVAIRPLNDELLCRCAATGVGAFDISDQVFPAYGSSRVIADLEIVANQPLANPRWYGGECLVATPAFLRRLVPRARKHCARYLSEVSRLAHHGDEAFVSAALNTLADEGQQIVEIGAYQAVGRHWAGNTHRDLRWYQHCCFVHLPDGKALIEREAQFDDFNPARFWRNVTTAHVLGRLRFGLKSRFGVLSLAPKLFDRVRVRKPKVALSPSACAPSDNPLEPARTPQNTEQNRNQPVA